MYGYGQQHQAVAAAQAAGQNYTGYETLQTDTSTFGTYNSYLTAFNQQQAALSNAAGYGGAALESYGNPYSRSTADMSASNSIPLGTGVTDNSAHYSGYEQAIIQHAQRMQSNRAFGVPAAQKTTKKAFGGNNGGGAGFKNAMGFKNPGGQYKGAMGFMKRRGPPKPPVDPSKYYCDICKITCGGPSAFQDHIAGKSHKRKEELMNGNGQPLAKNKHSYKCEVCNVTCTGKESFDTHVNGTKHNRALKNLQRLGKPMPENLSTVIEPRGDPMMNLPVVKKVIGVSATKFVGGINLNSTGGEDQAAVVNQENDESGDMGAPIGEEFLETLPGGKQMQFKCKLCDCVCGDPVARNLHIRGRRHRLQYKQKVDSSIHVDMKGGPRVLGIRGKRDREKDQSMRKLMSKVSMPYPLHSAGMTALPDTSAHDTFDEQHIQARLEQIRPDFKMIGDTERLIETVEKTLKKISDKLSLRNRLATEDPIIPDVTSSTVDDGRLLRGVIRVGPLGEHLLLKTDKQVNAVLLCKEVPTISLMQEIVSAFPENIDDDDLRSKLAIETHIEDSGFSVSLSDFDMKCFICLTCVQLRSLETEEKGESDTTVKLEKPADALPLEPCLRALADLRHTKYYQAQCIELHSLGEVVRLLRDISNRIDTWNVMPLYVIELIAYKAIHSNPVPIKVSDAFRRFFEVVASGQFMSQRAILADPCEKESVNALSTLSKQQRENVVCSAQHGLRLIAYDQIYTILGMERLSGNRKRPKEETESDESEAKKEKKDVEMSA